MCNKAGVMATVVALPPGARRIASLTRRTALMLPSHKLTHSGVTVLLLLEKLSSASTLPRDSARQA